MKVSIPKLHSIKFKSGVFADNVEHIGTGQQDLPAVNILEGAILANLKNVVIAGYDQDGIEYIAGTYANPKDAAYLFGRGQLQMLRYGDD